MKSFSTWNNLAIVASWPAVLFTIALLATGCALPSQLGLTNQEADPLDKLTRRDEPAEPSPYPTALNNPHRLNSARQQVSRPVTAAPSQSPNPVPQTPLLPLQQQAPPQAMPLRREELFNRLPIQTSDAARPALPPDTHPKERVPEAIVLTPAPASVQELFAAKESAWLPPAAFHDVKLNVTPKAAEPAAPPPEQKPDGEPGSPTNPEQTSNPKPEANPQPGPTRDELLEKLIASVESEIRERTKRNEEAELPALEQKLRLLQLVADRSDDAVEKIDRLPAAEREAYKQLMFALSTWLSPDEAKRTSLRNAKVLRTLQEVDNRLATISKLDLKNLTFCEKVESFGWFTEFPRAEFSPKQQVILYVEVQNFAAEEKTATSFETELQGSYQIFDAAGNIVDERQLPLDREVCRNFRRDYFLAYRIYLPGELSPGRYRLELAIEDLKAKQDFKGRKQGEAMIEFSIK